MAKPRRIVQVLWDDARQLSNLSWMSRGEVIKEARSDVGLIESVGILVADTKRGIGIAIAY